MPFWLLPWGKFLALFETSAAADRDLSNCINDCSNSAKPPFVPLVENWQTLLSTNPVLQSRIGAISGLYSPFLMLHKFQEPIESFCTQQYKNIKPIWTEKYLLSLCPLSSGPCSYLLWEYAQMMSKDTNTNLVIFHVAGKNRIFAVAIWLSLAAHDATHSGDLCFTQMPKRGGNFDL